MKGINKLGILILSLSMLIMAWSCETPDDDLYIHDSNLISQMVCKASKGGAEYIGEIYEYDKDGELMSGEFTQDDVEGGYGLILFAISESLNNDIDLADVYLSATVTYDEIITPSLSGRHDITGDEGIVVTVKSGVGTKRKYRIRGFYE